MLHLHADWDAVCNVRIAKEKGANHNQLKKKKKRLQIDVLFAEYKAFAEKEISKNLSESDILEISQHRSSKIWVVLFEFGISSTLLQLFKA